MPYRVKGNAGKRHATPKDIARNTYQNTEDLFNAELVEVSSIGLNKWQVHQ